jgi:hypothetical protein
MNGQPNRLPNRRTAPHVRNVLRKRKTVRIAPQRLRKIVQPERNAPNVRHHVPSAQTQTPEGIVLNARSVRRQRRQKSAHVRKRVSKAETSRQAIAATPRIRAPRKRNNVYFAA